MQSKAPNRNRFWADLLVEELFRNGVNTFFAAPGSRSTPLVMAAYDHPGCELIMHFDERGTAFMALGYGKATGRAAAWITTSGTALANGYPAIVEADLECTPIILLTADRPPELRDTDANQTIRQEHIFGKSVRWFFDMPAPSDEIDPAFVLTTVDQAVFRSSTGPVHLNCMFREPLAPSEQEYAPVFTRRFEQWSASTEPYTVYSSDGASFSALISDLESLLEGAERPLLVLGRMQGKGIRIAAAAEAISRQFGCVYAADISSQARLGLGDAAAGCGLPHLDILLTSDRLRELGPDCIIQLGATPLSKQLQTWMKATQAANVVVIDERGRRIDSSHLATRRVEADPVELLIVWGQKCVENRVNEGSSQDHWTEWQLGWRSVLSHTTAWLAEDVLGGRLSEQAAATVVSRAVGPECALTIGSSTPVRHMDSFGAPDGLNVPVLTNRGASGIDGTIASAVGFATGHDRRPVVFLGDLTLLHDLNSLALCASRGAVIVVINNDGGGIFSYLPVRAFETQFEPLFGTPHGFGFEAAATLFHLDYLQPNTLSDLEQALSEALAAPRGCLIEIGSDREANITEARRLGRALRDRLTGGEQQAGI